LNLPGTKQLFGCSNRRIDEFGDSSGIQKDLSGKNHGDELAHIIFPYSTGTLISGSNMMKFMQADPTR
jgi:hypothetical protein